MGVNKSIALTFWEVQPFFTHSPRSSLSVAYSLVVSCQNKQIKGLALVPSVEPVFGSCSDLG